MNNKLIEYFSKITSLTTEEQNALVESMEVKSFSKGELVIKEGQNNKDTFFVLKGFLRQYKLNDGEEITTNFYGERAVGHFLGKFHRRHDSTRKFDMH